MSRARLQGLVAGGIASIALWQTTMRDLWVAHQTLAETMQANGLALPRPQVQLDQLPPLRLADAPDWRYEREREWQT